MEFLYSAVMNSNNIETSFFLKNEEEVKMPDGTIQVKEYWRPDVVKSGSKISLMKGKIEVDSIEFDNTLANGTGGYYMRFLNFKTRDLNNLYLHINLYYCDCKTKKIMLIDKDLEITPYNYKTELDNATPEFSDSYPLLKPDIEPKEIED